MIGGRAERISLVVALAGALAVGLVAPAAQAAEGPFDSLGDGASSGSSALIGTTVGATITTAALVFMTVKLADSGNGGSKAKAKEAAAAYLLAHHVQLHQDLARGSGPFVDDIAAAASIRVENVPRLGTKLRENRAGLADLADRTKLTPDRAFEFFVQVAALCRADPTLAADFASGS